jgi:NADH-quinone oxidoreductase subunit N
MNPALAPLLSVSVGALIILLAEAFTVRRKSKIHLAILSQAAILAAAFFFVKLWGRNVSAFNGNLRLDDAAILFSLILLLSAAFTLLIAWRWIEKQNAAFGEFYGLLLLALAGLMIMIETSDLLIVFLGLEVFSVSAYALTGLKKNDPRASEAAVKYFLIGSFAGAFLVFGLAILFGAVGTFEIAGIVAAVDGSNTLSVLPLLGFGLVLIGLAFKIGLVPFHMWQPDVYEGAPTPVTSFFIIAPKTAGFFVLWRLFQSFWPSLPVGKDMVFAFLYAVAILTMMVGSLGALRQRNLKRLLAYSSIAQAGYMLIAILARDGSGLAFYLVNYLFMSAGAFAALAAMTRERHEYGDLEDFAGIGFRYPWIGAIFTVILLSMAGFPPTGGFLAKFTVFGAAVREGLTPLVIVGVLTSLLSVYYYLRIVVVMYMKESDRAIDIEVENPSVLLVLFLCLYGVLQLGIFPGNILHVIRQAMSPLL